MLKFKRELLSGNEAIALAALHNNISLGAGYPGTPSTEILEHFSAIGGDARWSPNEKVALEVGIGMAFTGALAPVTMKHVGLNPRPLHENATATLLPQSLQRIRTNREERIQKILQQSHAGRSSAATVGEIKGAFKDAE